MAKMKLPNKKFKPRQKQSKSSAQEESKREREAREGEKGRQSWAGQAAGNISLKGTNKVGQITIS